MVYIVKKPIEPRVVLIIMCEQSDTQRTHIPILHIHSRQEGMHASVIISQIKLCLMSFAEPVAAVVRDHFIFHAYIIRRTHIFYIDYHVRCSWVLTKQVRIRYCFNVHICLYACKFFEKCTDTQRTADARNLQ